MITRRPVIGAILAVQAACAVFFVSDILSALLPLRAAPPSWRTREMIEIGAALGLILGLVLGAVALHRTARGRAAAEARLARAQGAFRDLLAERFAAWGLTPAEADVAAFAIKGMSTAEIAGLRGVAEGTVKAQTAAIYRKAGVSGRGQLLALFIEDMMRDDPPRAP
jgi:DNA-binding CsgD family transcriptional regulator